MKINKNVFLIRISSRQYPSPPDIIPSGQHPIPPNNMPSEQYLIHTVQDFLQTVSLPDTSKQYT